MTLTQAASFTRPPDPSPTPGTATTPPKRRDHPPCPPGRPRIAHARHPPPLHSIANRIREIVHVHHPRSADDQCRETIYAQAEHDASGHELTDDQPARFFQGRWFGRFFGLVWLAFSSAPTRSLAEPLPLPGPSRPGSPSSPSRSASSSSPSSAPPLGHRRPARPTPQPPARGRATRRLARPNRPALFELGKKE